MAASGSAPEAAGFYFKTQPAQRAFEEMTMSSKPIRVIQWGTGAIGKYCINTALRRPDLELVGTKVFSEAKNGQDVGEIVGKAPIGIKAQIDKKAVLAIDADVVLYAPLFVDLDDMCDILASGKDLITPSGFFFLVQGTERRKRIDEACAKGGSTLFASGIHPGFSGDRQVLLLSALCSQITKITVYELVSMATMSESPDMVHALGFDMDEETAKNTPPHLLETMSKIFIEGMQTIATGLGWRIDEYKTRHEFALTLEDSPTSAGVIKAGRVGGQHFNYQSYADGKLIIDYRTYWRMADKLDKEWNEPMTGLNYVVEIEGSPGVRSEIFPLGKVPAEDGLEWTAALVTNAIGAVVAASAGFKTVLDMPLLTAAYAVEPSGESVPWSKYDK
jgi:hypothetical protein